MGSKRRATSVSEQRRQVEVALAGGTYDAGRGPAKVSAPLRVRLSAAHLADDDGGPNGFVLARQLVASTDGSHRNVKRAPNSLARCAAKRSASSSSGGLSISRLLRRRAVGLRAIGQERGRSACRRCRTVAQREAGLQGVLHLSDAHPQCGCPSSSSSHRRSRCCTQVGARRWCNCGRPPTRRARARRRSRLPGPLGRRRIRGPRRWRRRSLSRGDGRPQPVAAGSPTRQPVSSTVTTWRVADLTRRTTHL